MKSKRKATVGENKCSIGILYWEKSLFIFNNSCVGYEKINV